MLRILSSVFGWGGSDYLLDGSLFSPNILLYQGKRVILLFILLKSCHLPGNKCSVNHTWHESSASFQVHLWLSRGAVPPSLWMPQDGAWDCSSQGSQTTSTLLQLLGPGPANLHWCSDSCSSSGTRFPYIYPRAYVYMLQGPGSRSATDTACRVSPSPVHQWGKQASSGYLEPFITENDMFSNALSCPLIQGEKTQTKQTQPKGGSGGGAGVCGTNILLCFLVVCVFFYFYPKKVSQ